MAESTKNWYDSDYAANGINAQRQYPNEELCRFMGRNFFHIPAAARNAIRILELGCGTCGNLWMIAKEGFDAYGCDLSQYAIQSSQTVFEKWGVSANLITCDMTATSYEDAFFDAVLDVFSSYCMNLEAYRTLLAEVLRILKSGGTFFSYFPSKESDTYKRYVSNGMSTIDVDTMNGIQDSQSPFCGQAYPFRFMSQEDVRTLVSEVGLTLTRLETTGRTYDNGNEYFEWLVFEARKD